MRNLTRWCCSIPDSEHPTSELLTYEGEDHSFFGKDKYYALTIAETDEFLVGLDWLDKKAGAP